jgi:nicotinate dehydrogenase subunit B
LVQCDTAVCPDQGTTSGSQSTPTNFNERNLAQAGATARQVLLGLAATRLGVPAGQLQVTVGIVFALSDRNKRVSYGDLVAGKKFNMPMDRNATRKAVADWKVLGTSVRRVDMADGHRNV